MIENEKFLEYVTGSVLDYAAKVDVESDNYAIFVSSRLADKVSSQTGSDFFGTFLIKGIVYVFHADRELVLSTFSKETLLSYLSNQNRFILHFRAIGDDDKILYKEIEVTWFDREKKILCLIQKDVTDSVETENSLKSHIISMLTSSEQRSSKRKTAIA